MRTFYACTLKHDGRSNKLTVRVWELDPHTFELLYVADYQFIANGSWFYNIARELEKDERLHGSGLYEPENDVKNYYRPSSVTQKYQIYNIAPAISVK